MDYIAQDEQRHIAFGVKLLSDIAAPHPECRRAVADLLGEVHSDGGNLLDGGDGNDVITSERWDGFNPDWPGGADTVTAGEGDGDPHPRPRARRDLVRAGH